MKERWADAVWLGKRKSSDEHICLLGDGSVAYTASVRIREEREKLSWGIIERMRGTPWNANGDAVACDHVAPEAIPCEPKEKLDAIIPDAQ